MHTNAQSQDNKHEQYSPKYVHCDDVNAADPPLVILQSLINLVVTAKARSCRHMPIHYLIDRNSTTMDCAVHSFLKYYLLYLTTPKQVTYLHLKVANKIFN